MAVATLAFSSLTLVHAKTYSIILSGPAKAGSLQLKAGQYKLKVEGSTAVFTDVNTSHSYTTPVKIESGDKKFNDTRVESVKEDGADKIEEIDLGGSSTKLGF